MRVVRNILTYTLIMVTTVVVTEVLSFVYLFVENIRTGQPRNIAYTSTLRMSPIFYPKPFYGNYDPLHRQYLEPYREFGNLVVNKWGFIGNGDTDPVLNHFPEKPNGVYRIVLFGGSSGAGEGASSNAKTMAAQLERLLNGKSGKRFQVLNYGIPGGYSFYELTKYIAEASYLQPDVVVFLDGWNDFIANEMEASRFHLPHAMANWDYLAHQYFELLHGINAAPDHPPAVFTYSYIVAKKLTTAAISSQINIPQADKLKVYEHHPLFGFTRHIMEDPAYPGNVYRTNIEAMAAFSIAKGITFLHYLQPYPEFGKILTQEEMARIEEMHAEYVVTYGPEWSFSTFTQRLNEGYAKFRMAEAELAEKYEANPHVRFSDLTMLFTDAKERTYTDIIHYNDRGQEILARRFADDVLATVTRPHR